MTEVEGASHASSQSVRFAWSSVKIPEQHPPRHSNAMRLSLPPLFSKLEKARDLAMGIVASFVDESKRRAVSLPMHMPLLCCTSISTRQGENKKTTVDPKNGSKEGVETGSKDDVFRESSIRGVVIDGNGKSISEGEQKVHTASCRHLKEEQERVLVSEVLIRNKEGEELENAELRNEALGLLKACKPNSALTVQEVQEDVLRLVSSGYFSTCMPVAVDTRDGVRLVFQVEPNQEFKGLICEGANVLPTKFVEDAFKEDYGKIVNFQRLDKVLRSINSWYSERGLLAKVSGIEILSGGILLLQVSETEVNNINIQFLDKKTGEPTLGKTRPETLLRQLTTRRGQVYSVQQGKRDVETVLTMGIMEDANMVPHPAGDTGKIDLTMNVVERSDRGFSAGGGFSGIGLSGGLLPGIIGSCTYSRRNLFGCNQKLNLLLEKSQMDSLFKLSYSDPWIKGDDKRTSRLITFQNLSTLGSSIHGPKSSGSLHSGIKIGKVMASVDYGRPLRPKWSGTAGISFQRATARDDNGISLVRDEFQTPLFFSGKDHDDMVFAKMETVYADSRDQGSSMLVFNMEQGLPLLPDWLVFTRVNVRGRQGIRIGPARCVASFSGGNVYGDLAPHEAFAIGGTNSVRGYEEGAVGSARSFFVGSAEISVPLYNVLDGAIFVDYGTDFGSGQTVPGDPAGARGKPGSGYGYGAGIRVNSPIGPLRLEYAQNNLFARRFHFGVGYRD